MPATRTAVPRLHSGAPTRVLAHVASPVSGNVYRPRTGVSTFPSFGYVEDFLKPFAFPDEVIAVWNIGLKAL